MECCHKKILPFCTPSKKHNSLMALLVGPRDVGKTVLTKRLQDVKRKSKNINGDLPLTNATVGTNLTTIPLNKRQEVTIREMGGCMGPIWKSYYADCRAIIYMVDMSNTQQVSAAFIQLVDLLRDKNCQSSRVLLLFNKIDLMSTVDRDEYKVLFMLEDLKQQCANLSVKEISCVDWNGLNSVLEWLEINC